MTYVNHNVIAITTLKGVIRDWVCFKLHSCSELSWNHSFFLNHLLLPCGVQGFLLVNLLDKWEDPLDG
jgi:hypothetical protein